MMNREEQLQAQQQELQKQLDELSEKIAEWNNPKPKMFSQKEDRYWFFDVHGKICSGISGDNNGRLNTYKTKEEATRARDIQWAKQRVAYAIEVANGGWKPDWDNCDEKKYASVINNSKLVYDYYFSMNSQPNYMYCKSKEIANQIISEHEEDLLLIFSE